MPAPAIASASKENMPRRRQRLVVAAFLEAAGAAWTSIVALMMGIPGFLGYGMGKGQWAEGALKPPPRERTSATSSANERDCASASALLAEIKVSSTDSTSR